MPKRTRRAPRVDLDRAMVHGATKPQRLGVFFCLPKQKDGKWCKNSGVAFFFLVKQKMREGFGF